MERRGALTVLATFPFVAASRRVGSQPVSRVRRIGWLVTGWGEPRTIVDYLDVGVRGRGWIPGKNITYDIRVAHGTEPELLDKYAAELVGLNVDVLVTLGEPAVRAAMKATSTIPIVFSGVSDPVKNGFVSSLSRPTGNVTGYATFGEEERVKRIEALRELVPQVRTVAVLIYGARPADWEKRQGTVDQAYAPFGIRPITLFARTEGETDWVIDTAARQRVDALSLPAVGYRNAPILAAAALRNRLPSFAADPKLVESGILLSLSADFNERDRIVGDLVDRILNGSKPADLAVHRATKFEIVVNGKTARALGIRIPQTLLVRARLVQ